MTKGGGMRGRPGRPKGAATGRPPKKAPKPARRTPPAETSTVVPTGPFRLGAIPGATPGKWIDAWNDRMPAQPLELVPLSVDQQRDALIGAEVDAALVRLPIDRTDLHVIPLYDEVPVVVTSTESHLTAAEALTIEDLAGEVRLIPRDDVLSFATARTVEPSFEAPDTTADAIETVATGVGLVVVPMSLARLHQRRDAAHRVLSDGPSSTVALAWIADRTTPSIETFVGIVRGRTANSSRD